MLVCQTFTMSDLVMLLHGQHQPLGRIQPQLFQFFTQNYLNGREPSDENISVSTSLLSDSFLSNTCRSQFNLDIFCFLAYGSFQSAANSLVNELEEYITESFVSSSSPLLTESNHHFMAVD